MRNLIGRFVRDEFGAIHFEDGLTVISLTVGFIAALLLLNGTIVQLYTAIFGMLPGSN